MKKNYVQPLSEAITTIPVQMLLAGSGNDDEGVGGTVKDGENTTPGGNFDPSTPGTGGADAPPIWGVNWD
ncbi:MAG: hypothetical protein J6I31_04235 [Prevotella sp.]|nr:hypothetical protein [Prevotella sp.]